MSAARRLLSILVLAAAAGTAQAEDIQGTLTMHWGDPLSGTQAERFNAEIVGKNGYRYAVDTQAALADGLPLLDLGGKDVLASVDTRQKSGARPAPGGPGLEERQRAGTGGRVAPLDEPAVQVRRPHQ